MKANFNILKTLVIVALATVVVACGKKEDNSLKGKKDQLAQLQKEATTIDEKIQKLQAEIDKLEPNKIEILPYSFNQFRPQSNENSI